MQQEFDEKKAILIAEESRKNLEILKEYHNSSNGVAAFVEAVTGVKAGEISPMIRGSGKSRAMLAILAQQAVGRLNYREASGFAPGHIFFDEDCFKPKHVVFCDEYHLTIQPASGLDSASDSKDPKIKGLLRSYNLSVARRDKAGAKRVLKQLESMGFRP